MLNSATGCWLAEIERPPPRRIVTSHRDDGEAIIVAYQQLEGAGIPE
jgi:hypothetical protein